MAGAEHLRGEEANAATTNPPTTGRAQIGRRLIAECPLKTSGGAHRADADRRRNEAEADKREILGNAERRHRRRADE